MASLTRRIRDGDVLDVEGLRVRFRLRRGRMFATFQAKPGKFAKHGTCGQGKPKRLRFRHR